MRSHVRTTTDLERRRRTVELLGQARGADGEQRRALEDELVRLNMPVAEAVASRYLNRGLARDDVHQVAYLALVKAVQRYDADRAGEDFLSYAVPTIRGEIRRHFRDAGWMVRPTRRVQELQTRLSAAREELQARLQRTPSTLDLVEHLEEPEAEVLEALNVNGCFAPASLDTPVGEEDGGATLGDFQVARNDDFEAAEARAILRPLIDELGDRERQVVVRRFRDGLSQQVIGDELGMSQVQVSRLLARVLRRLRTRIGELGGRGGGAEAA